MSTSAIVTDLTCPDCGARLRYRTQGRWGPWYACENAPQCKGAVGAHPNGAPMGVPADTRTRLARVAAHAAFDSLWQPGSHAKSKRATRRKRAYARLARYLDLSKDDCHIGNFSAAQCARVVEWARREQLVDRNVVA